MAYTKLFAELIHSTVWIEAAHIKITWITMLAMSDDRHEIRASIPGLAKAAGVTLKECQDALACFLSSDEFSRSQEFKGRRIEPVDGGWRLLNGAKYRAMRSVEERREYQRKWQADKRAKTQIEKKKKKKSKFIPPTKKEVEQFAIDNGFQKELGERAWQYYEEGNWKDANKKQVINWKQKIRGVWFKEENKYEADKRFSKPETGADVHARQLSKLLKQSESESE